MDGRARPILLVSIVVVLSSGCATSSGSGWGADATLSPGWARIGAAAKRAALAPETWMPLAGAGLVQIDHADHRISHWATSRNPVFGSQHTAAQVSDFLLGSSMVFYAATALAAPRGHGHEWIANELKGGSVGLGAGVATASVTFLVKRATHRLRPNGISTTSFPSGHTSGVTVLSTLAADNVRYLDVSWGERLALDGVAGGLSLGTAWARVEGKRHWPSDVLAGMALGHFIGSFADRAFLDPRGTRLEPLVGVSRDRFFLGFSSAF